MTDYLKLFSEMLEGENGEKKVADFLDEIATAANRAVDEKKKKMSKKQAIAEVARIIKDNCGDYMVFTKGNYTPADAAEAMFQALDDMEKVLQENKDLAEWLLDE